MKFRGEEFSTGTTGNFQPELTNGLRLNMDEGSLDQNRQVFVLPMQKLFERPQDSTTFSGGGGTNAALPLQDPPTGRLPAPGRVGHFRVWRPL
jgi:hypothetical protein